MSLSGTLYALAGLVGAVVWWRRLVARGVAPGSALLGMGVASWAGVAGAFGVHAVVAAIPSALPGPPRLTVWGGSTVLGAILGGSVMIALWARLRRDEVGVWLDALAGAAPLTQAIGRLGCLAAGCCFGKPSASWLALPLPDVTGTVLPRHPTQLLASAADLLILGVILRVERHFARRQEPPVGRLFALYLGLYGTKRFVLEFLRATASPLLLGLTWAQIAAILCVVAAFLGTFAPRLFRR